MTEEEERRHHDAALVDKCCDETPGGDKNRALFSHVSESSEVTVLAEHLARAEPFFLSGTSSFSVPTS